MHFVLSNLPGTLKPMFARLTRRPFDSPDYFFELKWDGIRALAITRGSEMHLLDRTSADMTYRFPELLELPRHVKGNDVVLDGELVCLDHLGRPSFARLQRRLKRADSITRNDQVHFVAFDVLYRNGDSVMREPLHERKNILQEILEPSEIAQSTEFIENDGEAFFQATCALGLEGIVAKKKSSLYVPGKRSRYWLKVKRTRETEFVVGGYAFGGRKREPFSSLLLGLFDNEGNFVFVGEVSVGIPRSVATGMYEILKGLHMTECPFDSVPEVSQFLYWCHPEIVCKIEYGEFTEEGRIVYPVFKALREDKSPAECILADAPGWPSILAGFV